MEWQQFLALAGAHFLALLSPGPDFVLLLNHTFHHGRRAGYRTALGIACANAIFILAALFGLGWLQDNPLAYALMYWVGCGYLAWLGWQFWQAKSAPIRPEAATQAYADTPNFFVRGFASGILNPKNAMFYLTLFTVLVGKESSLLSRSLTGIWMFSVVLLWDCLVSWTLSHPKLFVLFSNQQRLLHRGSAYVMFTIVGVMTWSMLIGT
ncbi:MAG: neutral amino-acid efflux system [Burkholderiaceae bacterium]|nr:neutral amino-acid efflux system [Burkholderiaceae bacterium]